VTALLRTPKAQMLAIFAVLLSIAVPAAGGAALLPNLAAAIAAGVWMAERLNKFPLVLTFLAVYFGFFAIASVSNAHAVAEMFREPFLQAALFFGFFMLTDPPTSPNRYFDQVWFGVLAAFTAGAAQLLGAGQVYLLVGVLVPNAALGVVRYVRRHAARRPLTLHGLT
jgi:Na+-translocating ferredoxin:NAD+ oxidoreductase RnfD subunit